jgi:PAS domain S-box-containing protein
VFVVNIGLTGIRGREIFEDDLTRVRTQTSRVFLWLLLVQWLIAIVFSVVISPYAWSGRVRTLHFHVELAVLGGAILNALPIALIVLRPGWWGTRHTVAVTQMLWSAMFIHLTGGRIETHFHIFGSLAFLAFYRDPRLFFTATAVVAIHHLLLGFFDPLSIYGISNPEWWRFLEHAAWVVFEDIVLLFGCQRQLSEMATLADREAILEIAKESVEHDVALRTEELRAKRERYRSLIENTSAVPWEIDCETCEILYMAPQMSKLFAIAEDRIVAHENFLELLHPDDRENFHKFVRAASGDSPGLERHIDSRIVGADGRVKHVRSFIAERHPDARHIGGICLDITQQKQMEVELIQAQKLESIGQLAAGIAHEINTPTQFIGDNIRFVQESVAEVFGMIDGSEASKSTDVEYLRTEVPRAITQSLEGIDRISRIVGAMKDFSHPSIERTPYDINHAIASTITVASNEWKYVAEVTTEFDTELPLVPVMPGAFNQVILNMLVNAAHAIADVVAASPGGGKGRIIISTARVGEWAEIRIRDTGCGMPEGIRERIFDPFFTTKQVGKGTGQGLAIAHDVIVKKHSGSIAVDSTVGVGTTFVLRLPLETSVEAVAA